jgi:hypothetical protein
MHIHVGNTKIASCQLRPGVNQIVPISITGGPVRGRSRASPLWQFKMKGEG